MCRWRTCKYLAGHTNPQTAQIYDRRRRRVTRNIVERIVGVKKDPSRTIRGVSSPPL